MKVLHAVLAGDFSRVKELNEAGEDLDFQEKVSPELNKKLASYRRLVGLREEDVRIMIGKETTLGRTPLAAAVAAGNYEITEYLLENGAKRQVFDFMGRTPLQTAIANEKPDLIRLLIEGRGKKPKKLKMDKTTIFVQYDISDPVIEAMLTADFSQSTLDAFLVAMIKRGDVSLVKRLLDRGAGPNAKNSIGITALQLLLASDMITEYGKKPLDPKAKGEIVELLLKQGADPNLRARAGGWTPS
ncbi:MAG TPA: ankyrin repeat domain-containing protein [Bdellovibrionota bacterium]|nr:ankyrin repeat domain-containing protein [Bdellovibrionota bacterium]